MTATTGTSAARLAALFLRRESDADFTLLCQDRAIPVHSFVLVNTQVTFLHQSPLRWFEISGQISLRLPWPRIGWRKKDRKMELKDCSPDVLDIAVNFMYGIKVTKYFTKLRELLHLGKLSNMVAAFGRIAMKKKSNSTCPKHGNGIVKSREDFASDELFGDYVSSVLKPVPVVSDTLPFRP